MALEANPEELSLEDLASLVESRSFDIMPQTEFSPGLTETGSIPEASAALVPSSGEPEVELGESITDRRRQAALSRLRNMRDAQEIQMETT